MTGAKWISSIAIHPGGDNLLVGTFDKKVQWFDLDLSSMPYQVKTSFMVIIGYTIFFLCLPKLINHACQILSVQNIHTNSINELCLSLFFQVLRYHSSAVRSVGEKSFF
jgi:hypothetical protein